MEKIYFIRKSTNLAVKNKLDELLHQAFSKFNHRIIREENLSILDNEFNEVTQRYKYSGGRCQIPKYSRQTFSGNDSDIVIHISESCSFILFLVRGEIG